jgi:hypothetical protein
MDDNMSKHRFSTASYIIFALIAIGVLARLLASPGTLLIPVIVFGVVFLLYKFPPARIKRQFHTAFSGKEKTGPRRNTRTAKFRVIKGSKKDDPEQSEPPRYH